MSYAINLFSTPPTGIESATKGYVISNKEVNLIVAKSNILQIFRVVYDIPLTTSTKNSGQENSTKPIKTESNENQTQNNNDVDAQNSSSQKTEQQSTTSSNENNNNDSTPQRKAHLELVLEKSMFGNIVSVNVVRLPRSQLDAIILNFRDAKAWLISFCFPFQFS